MPRWVVALRVCLAVLIPTRHFLESSSGDTTECLVLDPIADAFREMSWGFSGRYVATRTEDRILGSMFSKASEDEILASS
jgi:hypothetical protein